MAKFKIPVVFIDELPKQRSNEIKLLSNIIRCLVLPCVLSSTNSNVSNMLKSRLSPDSSNEDDSIWVNAIHRILRANLNGIMKRVAVLGENRLIDYVDDDYNLKVSELLTALNMDCDNGNMIKLVNIWKFLVSQSNTCLQGSSYYSFYLFVQELKQLKGNYLNSCEFWSSLCKKIHLQVQGEKADCI